MNVLVVGGAGYIGSHCVRQLAATGHRPIVLDNLVFGHRGALLSEIPFYHADIADDEVELILKNEKIDLVMHFAAFAYVGESVEDPLKYYFNNSVATLHLLRSMVRCKVMRFVFSSTCATFGIPETVPISEDHPQHPINPYGQTKLDVENALNHISRATGMSFAAFRYFNAAGASEDGTIGEDHDPETHLIPLAIDAAVGKRPHLSILGTDYPTPDGTCLRDYVHVDDLSRAHIVVCDKLNTPGTQLFYNLGTGRPHSVLEIINAVETVSGKKVPRVAGVRRAGDPPSLCADSTKAREELEWETKFNNLESIIETAWKWHREHPDGFLD